MKNLLFGLFVVLFTSCSADSRAINLSLSSIVPISLPISGAITSVSIEIPCIQAMFNGSYNPIYRNALKSLKDITGVAPNIRMGGNSADSSWWPIPGELVPVNVTYNITSFDLLLLNSVAKDIGSKLSFGVNFLQLGNATWALAELDAINQYMDWDNIFAIEIGNEVPEMANTYPSYRPKPYLFSEYVDQWNFYRNAFSDSAKFLPNSPYMGASFDTVSWFPYLDSLIANSSKYCNCYSVHQYGLYQTATEKVSNLSELLTDEVISRPLAPLVDASRIAIGVGNRIVMGETNSVDIGGAPNVSDVFGVNLWGVDWVINNALINISMMNFHGCGGGDGYNLIGSTGSTAQMRPIFYTLYFIAQALKGSTSSLINLTTSTSDTQVKAYALRDAQSDALRIVIIDKNTQPDASSSVSVNLLLGDSLSGYASSASISTLSAPSLFSQSGISFSGLTFDDSSDGFPIGKYVPSWIDRQSDGSFQFTIAKNSIVLLELAKDKFDGY